MRIGNSFKLELKLQIGVYYQCKHVNIRMHSAYYDCNGKRQLQSDNAKEHMYQQILQNDIMGYGYTHMEDATNSNPVYTLRCSTGIAIKKCRIIESLHLICARTKAITY